MKALQIDRFGPISNLRVRDIAAPAVEADQVCVAVEAAAVNPSDIMSVEGRFPKTPLPRVVGRDFAGRIVAGPEELLERAVYGTGGDLGITRDGTHAEYIRLPRDAVAERPATLAADAAGAVGVPFVTAWAALVDLGQLQEGEWVIVSGAAGAVGDAAVQIAATRPARVIALVKDSGERNRVDHRKVAAIAQSDQNDLAAVVREATGGQGCALALNAVGGIIFQPLLDALADGGRMVLFSAAGGRDITLDLFTFYRRRLRLYGLNTAIIDASQGAQILQELTPLFGTGALRPPAIAARYPLEEAVEAYAQVASGVQGKVILLPTGSASS